MCACARAAFWAGPCPPARCGGVAGGALLSAAAGLVPPPLWGRARLAATLVRGGRSLRRSPELFG
eukprot:8979807-Alexandrium_andersonii.AAC.1